MGLHGTIIATLATQQLPNIKWLWWVGFYVLCYVIGHIKIIIICIRKSSRHCPLCNHNITLVSSKQQNTGLSQTTWLILAMWWSGAEGNLEVLISCWIWMMTGYTLHPNHITMQCMYWPLPDTPFCMTNQHHILVPSPTLILTPYPCNTSTGTPNNQVR